MFQGAKAWKPYWVEIKDNFLDISNESGKEPIVSFHIGVLKVRPSKDYPDRPDVLEFYDGDGFTNTCFFVFTYDPFDFLSFFKDICSAYKGWRDDVTQKRTPIEETCEIKQGGFFSGVNVWAVDKDKIRILTKNNQLQTTIQLTDNFKFTPAWNSSKGCTFKPQLKPNENQNEVKCSSNQDMKKLLNAIYTNAFILKLQKESAHQEVQQPSVEKQEPEPAQKE